jgi:putative transposase
MTTLMTGTVLQWEQSFPRDEYERILWLDYSQNLIILFPLTPSIKKSTFPTFVPLSDIIEAVECGEVLIRTVDPFARNYSQDSEMVINHGKERDKTWEKIKRVVLKEPEIYYPHKRSKLFKEAIDELGTSTATLYKNCRKYWKYGKNPNALLPLVENCGGPGKKRELTKEMVENAIANGTPIPKRGRKSDGSPGINLTKEDKEMIQAGLKKYYLNHKEYSLAYAHQKICEKYYTLVVDGKEIIDVANTPSFWQVKNEYYSNRDFKKAIITRKGEKDFQNNYSPKTGGDYQKDLLRGPGSIYQMDSTVSDVELISSIDPSRKIGKATVYFVMDIFSRFIVGANIGLEKGWDGAHRALFDAFTNTAVLNSSPSKELKDVCAVPKKLYVDKGSEFLGLNSDNLSLYFNIELVNAPAYRAALKGDIEERFNWLKNKLRVLPGFCKQHIKPRGIKDPAEEAAFTVESLRETVKDIVMTYNHKEPLKSYIRDIDMIKEKVEPYPVSLWEWGLKRTGSLTQFSYEAAVANLLPRGKAIITKNGIKFKAPTDKKSHENFFYTTRRAVEEGWFVKGGPMVGKTVQVTFDPHDADVLYIIVNSGKKVERCHLTTRHERYRGMHHKDIIDMLLMEKREKRSQEKKALNDRKELNDKVDKRVKVQEQEALQAIKRSGKSKTMQKRGKREAAAEERIHDQANTSITRHLNLHRVNHVQAEDQSENIPKRKQSKYQQILNQMKSKKE